MWSKVRHREVEIHRWEERFRSSGHARLMGAHPASATAGCHRSAGLNICREGDRHLKQEQAIPSNLQINQGTF